MALFKILKGPAANLGANGNATAVAHEGFAYFTPDDGKFYIDIQDADEAIIGVNRIPINSVKADKFSSDRTITITGSDITGTGTSNGTSGWSIAASLIDRPGLEAGSYGLANNDSPGYSGTFKVPYFTIDTKGRVTAASEYTITLPAAVENSHYITHLYAGTGGVAENSVSTNGNTKLILTDNAAIRNTITLQGSGATNVTSDNNGVITIYSENTWNLLSTSLPGYVPLAPNNSHKFLRGDATWADITEAKSTILDWDTESTIATVGGYDIKVKLPANPNTDTDTLVKLTAKSDAVEYKILAGANSDPTSGTAYEAIYDTAITLNPNTNTITATTFNGNATSATKAVQDGNGNNIVNTYLTKAVGVTNVAWNNSTKYITKTINGTTSNVIKIEQGTEASLTMTVDDATETLSFSWTTNVPTKVTAP